MHIYVTNPGTQISFSKGVLICETEEEEKKEIPLLHITALHITANARISTKAVVALIEAGAPLFIESSVAIEAILWTPSYSSISTIRKKQNLFCLSNLSLGYVLKLIEEKISNRAKLLCIKYKKGDDLSVFTEAFYLQIKQLKNSLQLVNPHKPALVFQKIRTLEAQASKLFFKYYFLLFNKKVKPKKREYKKATDAVNICLNYCYGILYRQITKCLIIAGLDPFCGIMHTDRHGKTSLTYDLIEPYRVWAEHIVLLFFKKEKTKTHAFLDEKGRLTKKYKKKLTTFFLDYLHKKKILRNRKKRSPMTHIQLDCYQLATHIKSFTYEELLNNIRY